MSGPPPEVFGRRRVRPRAMTTDDLIFVVFGLLLSVLLALTTVFWAAGKLSGRLHSGHWPNLSFADTPGVMVDLFRQPGHPANAYPVSARATIGPPGQYWGIVTLVGLLVAAVVVALLLAWFREGGLFSWRGKRLFGRARLSDNWARLGDLGHLAVEHSETGRITLGRMHGHLLAAERGQSVIVLGPSGSGRTSSFAVPSILEWEGPVVAVTMAPDLILDTLDRRLELGAVHVYDPKGSTKRMRRSGWTPLVNAGDWAEALHTAGSLAFAARELAGQGQRWQHLPDTSNLIAPLLFAAASSGRTMSDVVRWAQRAERDQVSAALEAAGVPAAADAIEGVWGLDRRRRGELYQAAQLILGPYADPSVAESAAASHLSAATLLDGGRNTAYLTAPAHDLPRLRPLFSAFLHEVITMAGRLAADGRILDPPLLVVIDDAADVGAIHILDAYAAAAMKTGVQFVSIFADLSEIRSYAGERADTIMNNHRAKVIMSGTAGAASIDYVANLLSDEEIQQVTQSYGEDGFQTSERSGYRRVKPADMLREIQLGEGLLVYGSAAPGELKLRPWYRDSRLLALAGRRPLDPEPEPGQSARVRLAGLRDLGPKPGGRPRSRGVGRPGQPAQGREATTRAPAATTTKPRLGGGIVFPLEDERADTSIDLAKPPAEPDPSTQQLPRLPAERWPGPAPRSRRQGDGEAPGDGSGRAR